MGLNQFPERYASVALDVAQGLKYMHGLAHRSFIHRDLKPSNILLRYDFQAKVSDFGLVKLEPEGKYSVETRLAGTFEYLEPDHAGNQATFHFPPEYLSVILYTFLVEYLKRLE